MSLRSRLGRLDRLPALGLKTFVVASVDPAGPDLAPGTVLPWDDGEGANLYVPADFAADPLAGLDNRQRAMNRAGDMVILMTHEELGDGSASEGEDWITWGETSSPRTGARQPCP
jgi:hypothetical protein